LNGLRRRSDQVGELLQRQAATLSEFTDSSLHDNPKLSISAFLSRLSKKVIPGIYKMGENSNTMT